MSRCFVHTPVHEDLFCRNFYKMDLGPKPGVSLRVAVLAEGALTYMLNLVILYATSELHGRPCPTLYSICVIVNTHCLIVS